MRGDVKGRVIAIDGPSGAGKSTISRMIARTMGFQYLDTGSLYRAVGLHLKTRGFRGDEADEVITEALFPVIIEYVDGRVFINGEDYSDSIRTTEAGHYASVFSARRAVRDFLLAIQQSFAKSMDLVAEGRDMTTVVFPDAWKKFYLDASVESRAKRRHKQMAELGNPISLEEALRDVKDRDQRDTHRDIAPLKVAKDAIYIDTTDLSIEEVVERMLSLLK